MDGDGTMCFINTILFISCLIFTCFCHMFPSTITRINSQAFASQIGRHFGQQSHHFQTLIWHIYHKSKIDRLIHIMTIVVDAFIWIFFITYYLPIYLQLIFVVILVFQALAVKIPFTLNTHADISNIDTGCKQTDESKCLDCETPHAHPKAIGHYISLFRMQWAWKYEYVCILSSFLWIVLYCTSHICLLVINFSLLPFDLQPLLPYVLEIMHTIIAFNALFRVIGHLLEPIPPFMIDNEQFLQRANINIPIIMVRRGEIFRLLQMSIAGYLSEYQAGLPFRFPQVFINMWISLLVKSSNGKSVMRHYHEQACRIRTKGWKAIHLTGNMFETFYH